MADRKGCQAEIPPLKGDLGGCYSSGNQINHEFYFEIIDILPILCR